MSVYTSSQKSKRKPVVFKPTTNDSRPPIWHTNYTVFYDSDGDMYCQSLQGSANSSKVDECSYASKIQDLRSSITVLRRIIELDPDNGYDSQEDGEQVLDNTLKIYKHRSIQSNKTQNTHVSKPECCDIAVNTNISISPCHQPIEVIDRSIQCDYYCDYYNNMTDQLVPIDTSHLSHVNVFPCKYGSYDQPITGYGNGLYVQHPHHDKFAFSRLNNDYFAFNVLIAMISDYEVVNHGILWSMTHVGNVIKAIDVLNNKKEYRYNVAPIADCIFKLRKENINYLISPESYSELVYNGQEYVYRVQSCVDDNLILVHVFDYRNVCYILVPCYTTVSALKFINEFDNIKYYGLCYIDLRHLTVVIASYVPYIHWEQLKSDNYHMYDLNTKCIFPSNMYLY